MNDLEPTASKKEETAQLISAKDFTAMIPRCHQAVTQPGELERCDLRVGCATNSVPPERGPQFADVFMNSTTSFESTAAASDLRPRSRTRRGPRRRVRRRPAEEVELLDDEMHLPGIGTMARTKRLILAALRVWELKRGIRD